MSKKDVAYCTNRLQVAGIIIIFHKNKKNIIFIIEPTY